MTFETQKTNGNSNGASYEYGSGINTKNSTKNTDMIISIEKKIAQPSPDKIAAANSDKISTEDLKKMFDEVITSKNEKDKLNMNWADDKTLVLDKLSGISLHNFLLKVEELGKNITFTKKTVIEIH